MTKHKIKFEEPHIEDYELKGGNNPLGFELKFEPLKLKKGDEKTKKLKKLEAIEREMGIDLITLFKALNRGIWVWYGRKKVHTSWCIAVNGNWGGKHSKTYFWLSYRVMGFSSPDYYEALDFKDYGKTWALTKEELE